MNFRFNKKTSVTVGLILIIVLILLDQHTKMLAVQYLMNKEDIVLIPGVFQLHYLENTGAAFSILEGMQVLFAIITPVLVLGLFYLLFRLPLEKKFDGLYYILVFLIAGALGNYIDRISNNYVVDFLYFSLINFPVFNVADCYVTVSVIILFILILFYYKDEDLEEIKKSLKVKKNG